MHIDAVSRCQQEFDYERLERSQRESRFQGAIFSPQSHNGGFSKSATISHVRSCLEDKVERTFLNSSFGRSMITRKKRPEASAEVAIDFEWGPKKEDNKVELTVTGKVQDNKGKYVEASVSQNNKDKGAVSVLGGVDKKQKAQDSSSKYVETKLNQNNKNKETASVSSGVDKKKG